MSATPTASPPRRRPRILWNVLEEHLDEACFLWKQRARILLATDYVLAELEEGDEGRLRAHLEGLVIGGEPAARRILMPALEAEEPERVAAAAWALLAPGGSDGLQAVLDRLVSAPESRLGLLSALELSERSGLDGHLLSLLSTVDAALQARLLEVLALRGTDASAALEQLAPAEGNPDLLAAALRAARSSPRAVAERWLRLGLEDARPQVRNAAIETGLILGSRAAWVACRRCVQRRAPQPRPALLALAMGGSGAELQLVIEAVSEPSLRAEALWALGFSGRRAAAEAALSSLRAGGDRLAVETFAAITGLPLEAALEPPPELESPEEAGQEQEEPSEQAHELLPGPALQRGKARVEAVEAWWRNERERFDAGGRYWRGQPWTAELLPMALEEAPLRARPVLAWELAIRSQGACLLEPRAWAHQQRRQLREARKLRLAPLSRAFEVWMTS